MYIHTHVHTQIYILLVTGVLFIRFICRVKYSLYCGGLPVYSLVYIKYIGLSGYKPGAYSSSSLFCLFCLFPAAGPDVNQTFIQCLFTSAVTESGTPSFGNTYLFPPNLDSSVVWLFILNEYIILIDGVYVCVCKCVCVSVCV